MKDITKKYTNGEVTIVWKPNQCIHSTICFKGLGQVFDPQRRPWITPESATTQQIIDQIKKCPSGALSYYRRAHTQWTLNGVWKCGGEGCYRPGDQKE